jgi:CubicO group peptidase (beta-lactamase class C family)
MVYHILKRATYVAFILLLLSSCASAPPKAPMLQVKGDYSYVKEYMSWFIQKEMKEKDIVGLSIALVDDQKIVWQEGFGYADRKYKINATPETLYRAGSVSKLFNGLAVMKLVEAGKMDLDQPLVTYLPEFSIKSRYGNTDGITPRTILTHHSGLPGDWIDGHWGNPPKQFTGLVKLIKKEYVAYPPNTVMSYSNLAVTLLGHAVQHVSGQEYSQFLDHFLLKPMRMTHSRFETGLSGSNAAKAYKDDKEITENPIRTIPSGGLSTTAADLARLAMLVNNHGKLHDRKIISPETLDTMFTVQNKDILLDLGKTIGLAWFINGKILAQKEPVYLHGGAMEAHRAMFMVALKSKIGVVVLANTSSADTNKIAKKLLQMAWETKNGKKLPQRNDHFDQIPANLKNSDFNGTFATVLGKVNITEKSPNRYKVKSSMGNFILNLENDNQYHLSYHLLGFIPINLAELGEAALITNKISDHYVIVADFEEEPLLVGVKVQPHPIHDAWKTRLGRYTLLNPPQIESWTLKSMELKIEDDFLVEVISSSGGKYTIILRTVNATEAIMEGLGRDFGETVRIIKDEGDDILTFSGLRFKRVD